ncbi:MAG: hypothetical protein COV67_04910 [Nitrospinae bacterium CG11_big_fil_rev_8_21_14_0_20_56_8]|nr:MAG: hypothetical protein COV67_04910 [Nitrospinae bacterium CG11_big_fil_rev_8_21_14_0_20_56_8]
MNVNPREKRILTGGGIFVIVYVLFIFVGQPVFKEQKRIEEKIAGKIVFLEKYFAILNQKDFYEKQKTRNQELEQELTRRFLDQSKPGLAANDLQKMLEGYAQQAKVQMPRVRIEKAKFDEGILNVPIEINIVSTLRGLTEFVRLIEGGQKFLVIDELNSRRSNQTDPEELQTQLVITGYIRELESKDSKKA